MFLLFCVLLVAGSLVEGLPIRRERYQRIKCRPDDNSVACFQKSPHLEQSQQSNTIDSNSQKVSFYPVAVPFSAEDAGSGNGGFSGEEPGSAKSYEGNSNEIRDSIIGYNLSGGNLII